MEVTNQWTQLTQMLSAGAKSANLTQSKQQKADADSSFRSLLQRVQQQTKQNGQDPQGQVQQPAAMQGEDIPMQLQMELAAAMMMVPMSVLTTAPTINPDQPQQQTTMQGGLVAQLGQSVEPAQVILSPQPTQPSADPLLGQMMTKEGQQAGAEQPQQFQQLVQDTQTQPQIQVNQQKAGTSPQPIVQGKVEQGGEQTSDGSLQTATPLFQALEQTPIKVADAPVLVDTTAPDMDAQLTKQLNHALEKGEYRLELKLSPKQLGDVVVELTRGADGALQVLLSATTERAAGILREHAPQLGTLLQANTQASVQVEVQRQQDTQQGQNHNWQQGEGGKQEQRQQNQRPRQQQTQDFIQQLRLGLVD